MKCLVIGLVLGACGVVQVEGAIYVNDGIGSEFSVFDGSNGLYTVDSDGPSLRISKSVDDGAYNMYSHIIGGVVSNFKGRTGRAKRGRKGVRALEIRLNSSDSF